MYYALRSQHYEKRTLRGRGNQEDGNKSSKENNTMGIDFQSEGDKRSVTIDRGVTGPERMILQE